MSVVITTINGILTATFTGTGALNNATAQLGGATTAIINGYSSIGIGAFAYATSLTSVTIPTSVTSIGFGAFKLATSLTSITIPTSVTSIGSDAFYGATGLVSILVDILNPNYSSLEGVLFNKNKQTIIQFPPCKAGNSYTIPDSVTSIGSSAFAYATSLTSITIPTSLISIDSNAFDYAIGLTSITIPPSVTRIGSSAFQNAVINTVYIAIPNGLRIPETTLNTRITFYGKSNVLILNSFILFTNLSLLPLSINERKLYSGLFTDDSPNPPQYTILSQPIDNLYISGNTVKSKYPFNYREYKNYPVQILGTNIYKNIVRSFNIQIVDLLDSDIIIYISNNKIPENSSIGELVGTLRTSDPDVGDTFTYQFISGVGSEDNSSFTIENDVLYTATTFNYSTQNTYSIRVKSTDSSGLSVENPILLHVVLPTVGSFETSGLVGNTSTIMLRGQNITRGALVYEITKQPIYGSIVPTPKNGIYSYVPNTNKQDSFEYVVKEDTMTSLPGIVIIYNYSENDIANIPRNLGTLTLDNISFDGNKMTFGTITTDTFIQATSNYILGTMKLTN
jgi:hypothetical protein